jgi:hypothetical protein
MQSCDQYTQPIDLDAAVVGMYPPDERHARVPIVPQLPLDVVPSI